VPVSRYLAASLNGFGMLIAGTAAAAIGFAAMVAVAS
jgi:hypothetical protein